MVVLGRVKISWGREVWGVERRRNRERKRDIETETETETEP